MLLTVFYRFYIVITRCETKQRNAALAQLVEHVICNLGVEGPSPSGSSIREVGTVGLRETVNLLGNRMGFDSLTSHGTSKNNLARFFILT